MEAKRPNIAKGWADVVDSEAVIASRNVGDLDELIDSPTADRWCLHLHLHDGRKFIFELDSRTELDKVLSDFDESFGSIKDSNSALRIGPDLNGSVWLGGSKMISCLHAVRRKGQSFTTRTSEAGESVLKDDRTYRSL